MNEMYTERLLDHYRQPRNKGHLDVPDPLTSSAQVLAADEYNPLCGDCVTIEARVEAGQLVAVRWDGRGCALAATKRRASRSRRTALSVFGP